MADTLTLPVDRIQAVLQECPGISALLRDGIIARLKTHNVAPAVAPAINQALTSIYILVDIADKHQYFNLNAPLSTAENVFKLHEWNSGSLLPYEFQEGMTIPHLVVVTDHAVSACNFFDLLMSQKELTITSLEFLIHGSSYELPYDLQAVQYDLEGTDLENWARGSRSIKILPHDSEFEDELSRHTQFVMEHGLRNLRGLDDQDRAFEERQNENYNNPVRRRGRRPRRHNNRDRRSRSRSPLEANYSGTGASFVQDF